MAEENQMSQQSTDEQSTSTSRRSVLSSLGAGVAALGVGVGSTGSAKAASASIFPTDPIDWSLPTGPFSIQNLRYQNLTLGYYADDDEDFQGSVEFTATACGSGEVKLNWSHYMNHSDDNPMKTHGGSSISVNGNKTQLVGPNHSFVESAYITGETTLSLNEGDLIAVTLSSGPGESQDGSIELEPQAISTGPLTSAPIKALDANRIRYWNIGGPFSVQLGEFSPTSKTAYLTVDADGTEILSKTVSSEETVNGEAYPPVDVYNGTDITLTTYRSASQTVQLDQQTHTIEWGSYIEF
jgi:hypothetical protein